ncbi:MAG: leucine-rich repeat domain-containing protein [Pirellulales bacterium]
MELTFPRPYFEKYGWKWASTGIRGDESSVILPLSFLCAPLRCLFGIALARFSWRRLELIARSLTGAMPAPVAELVRWYAGFSLALASIIAIVWLAPVAVTATGLGLISEVGEPLRKAPAPHATTLGVERSATPNDLRPTTERVLPNLPSVEVEIDHAIAESVGKPANEVTQDDKTSVTTLNVENLGITDIAFLGEWKNLTSVDLSSNQIVDLSAMAGLTKLTTVILDSNEIKDLAPLTSIKGLRVLRLSGNPVVDLRPLATLKELEVLDLIGEPTADTSPTDLAPLAGLTNLTELRLLGRHIVDVTALAGLTKLKVLAIGPQGSPI